MSRIGCMAQGLPELPWEDLARCLAIYGLVVESVNVTVRAYVPVRSGSAAPMCWLNAMLTGALETGALHALGAMLTCSGSGRLKLPLVRWPGSLAVSDASPAVEMTLAVVLAV